MTNWVKLDHKTIINLDLPPDEQGAKKSPPPDTSSYKVTKVFKKEGSFVHDGTRLTVRDLEEERVFSNHDKVRVPSARHIILCGHELEQLASYLGKEEYRVNYQPKKAQGIISAIVAFGKKQIEKLGEAIATSIIYRNRYPMSPRNKETLGALMLEISKADSDINITINRNPREDPPPPVSVKRYSKRSSAKPKKRKETRKISTDFMHDLKKSFEESGITPKDPYGGPIKIEKRKVDSAQIGYHREEIPVAIFNSKGDDRLASEFFEWLESIRVYNQEIINKKDYHQKIDAVEINTAFHYPSLMHLDYFLDELKEHYADPSYPRIMIFNYRENNQNKAHISRVWGAASTFPGTVESYTAYNINI